MKTAKTLLLVVCSLLSISSLFAQSGASFEFKTKCNTRDLVFTITNVGSETSPDSLLYYIIDGESVTKDYLPPIPIGVSKEITVTSVKLIQELQVQDPASEKENRMVGIKIANCHSPYGIKTWNLKGKFTQSVTKRNDRPIALGIQIGTLGAGATLAYSIDPRFTVRAEGNHLKLSNIKGLVPDIDNAKTTLNLKLATIGLKFDYFFVKNPKNKFHITLGGFYNASKFSVLAQPDIEPKKVGGKTIDNETIGDLTMDIFYKKINPYAGIGLGRLVPYNSSVGFKLEVGVLYTDSPKVDVIATGIIEPTSSQAEIIEHNIQNMKLYPVVNLYLSFKI